MEMLWEVGVPYGSRNRVAAVKEKRPIVIQGGLRVMDSTLPLQGLTGTLIGLVVDSRWGMSD
jgi:hypothetical protein